MTARHALVATLLASLTLLASCTEDEPVPQFPDPTTAAPSPSESTSTAAPETPEEFLRRFMVAEIDMQNSGEVDAYLAMTQDCDGCDRLAGLVESYYSAGGYVRLNQWKVLRVRPYPKRGPNAYVAFVRAPVTRYKESSSSDEATFPGGRATYLYEIERLNDDLAVTYTSELAS